MKIVRRSTRWPGWASSRAAYGLIWLIFGRWIEWDAISALYTALIALVISSVIASDAAAVAARRPRLQVAERAERAKAAFEARIAPPRTTTDATPGARRELASDAVRSGGDEEPTKRPTA